MHYVTYQLVIRLFPPVMVTVGRLGKFALPAGEYLYTGSARRNIEARIRRHLNRSKRLRWHIDYLLVRPEAEIVNVIRSTQPECALNTAIPGRVLVPGFGSSDCRSGCGSHLKYLG